MGDGTTTQTPLRTKIPEKSYDKAIFMKLTPAQGIILYAAVLFTAVAIYAWILDKME
jgi:hypothetical protein